ncbi:MAG TPA: thermonuclease family protein [Pyrinomonadaceae bacterium]|nr:thermonuclease family protein [Pyrinomonadaceae bacterium]
MKILRYIFLAIFTLILVQTAFSQQTFIGRVVEIVDGKTAVIQIDSVNKIKAELEYIEIPEPDQPLRQAVKEHLQTLLLGKNVEFVVRTMMLTRLVGKIYIGEVDISQQMLRDGAAWYAVSDKKYQDATESENYQIVEAQAKLEKRGIWGIDNLKPAWEFRAAKEKAKKEQELSAQNLTVEDISTKPTKKRTTVADQPKANGNLEMWANVSGVESKKVGGAIGLYSGYNSFANIGYTFTDGAFFDLAGGKTTQKVESRIFYVYQGEQPTGVQVGFVVAFLSEAAKYRFENSNSLTLVVDNKKLAIGKAIRFDRTDGARAQELLAYKVDRTILEKIVKAKKIKFTVGTFSGEMKDDFQKMVDNLLKNSK